MTSKMIGCTTCGGSGKVGDGMHISYDCYRCGGSGKEPVKKEGRYLLFLDCESGGLDPRKNPLLQVGAVAVRNGEIVGTYEADITFDPTEYTVEPRALEVNGIDLDAHMKKGIPPHIAVDDMNMFIGSHFTDPPILVGHNPAIDKYLLRYQLYEANGLNMDDYISHRMLDTMSLIWGLHLAGVLPKEACSSSGAFKYFGITVDKRHTGLGDSIATFELLNRLVWMIEDFSKPLLGISKV